MKKSEWRESAQKSQEREDKTRVALQREREEEVKVIAARAAPSISKSFSDEKKEIRSDELLYF